MDRSPLLRQADAAAAGPGALHHQHAVTVYAEMVAVLLMQEAELAIGRADADQHPARGGQARQHSAIDLGVRRCSRFVAPKRHFVKDGGNHGATANGDEDNDDATRTVRADRSVRPWGYTPHFR